MTEKIQKRLLDLKAAQNADSPMRCPRCGAAYIDYKNHPENKVFGEPGCVLLDKTPYTFQ